MVYDAPLAFGDRATLSPDSLLATQRAGSDYVGEIYYLKHDARQRFYWISEQTPEELSIFISYDSEAKDCPSAGKHRKLSPLLFPWLLETSFRSCTARLLLRQKDASGFYASGEFRGQSYRDLQETGFSTGRNLAFCVHRSDPRSNPDLPHFSDHQLIQGVILAGRGVSVSGGTAVGYGPGL